MNPHIEKLKKIIQNPPKKSAGFIQHIKQQSEKECNQQARAVRGQGCIDTYPEGYPI